MPKILLLENIHPLAVEHLTQAGFKVQHERSSPQADQLIAMAKDFDAVGIRSKTKLNADVLSKLDAVSAIGCFCIGTDQVDLLQAARMGVPVFNAPYSNTRSVAELVLAEIIALARGVFPRSQKAHKGIWDKSADDCHEVRGQTLGIVGYGHIGSQVSVLAEALGLKVIYFDVIPKLPLGNAQPVGTLEELLKASDFVTLHVPDTESTRWMIGSNQLKLMKPRAFLLNASRGTVVDIQALAHALRGRELSGAAIDVFPEEPASNADEFRSELQGLDNVILTPHIGGSTIEAQRAIAIEVAQKLVSYLNHGNTHSAVNFPKVDVPLRSAGERLVNVHRNEPGVLRSINTLISERGLNIVGQYLGTSAEIGFVVIDVADGGLACVAGEIAQLKSSIRTQVFSDQHS